MSELLDWAMKHVPLRHAPACALNRRSLKDGPRCTCGLARAWEEWRTKDRMR